MTHIRSYRSVPKAVGCALVALVLTWGCARDTRVGEPEQIADPLDWILTPEEIAEAGPPLERWRGEPCDQEWVSEGDGPGLILEKPDGREVTRPFDLLLSFEERDNPIDLSTFRVTAEGEARLPLLGRREFEAKDVTKKFLDRARLTTAGAIWERAKIPKGCYLVRAQLADAEAVETRVAFGVRVVD